MAVLITIITPSHGLGRSKKLLQRIEVITNLKNDIFTLLFNVPQWALLVEFTLKTRRQFTWIIGSKLVEKASFFYVNFSREIHVEEYMCFLRGKLGKIRVITGGKLVEIWWILLHGQRVYGSQSYQAETPIILLPDPWSSKTWGPTSKDCI